MPLSDYNAYLAALDENRAADVQMGGANPVLGTANGRLHFAARNFVPSPSIPTTSVALDRTSDLAIGPLPVIDTGTMHVLGARLNPQDIGGMAIILADLLVVSGGLSAAVTSAQTTNLPTAALPRYTSGAGVMAGLCIWSAIGATATTATVSYTNQAGATGRVSTPVQIGGNNVANSAGRLIALPLESGDTGVRAVASVTLAATTGTAGNFGVMLFKPLCMFSVDNFQGAHVLDAVSSGGFIGALAEVHPDACLSVLAVSSRNQGFAGAFILSEV